MDSPGKPDFNGITDPGRVRTSNEDQFLIAELAKSMLVHQTSLAIDDSTRLAAEDAVRARTRTSLPRGRRTGRGS